jgi:hypothetical protein
MATIAVFVALGGAGYAAFRLPANSVRSGNIVNGQVKIADTSNALGFKCPKRTRYFEGACLETRARAKASWDDALARCNTARRRLASVAELDGFRIRRRVELVGFEWTSDYATLDATTSANFSVVSDDGQHDLAPRAQLHAYRCAAGPKR